MYEWSTICPGEEAALFTDRRLGRVSCSSQDMRGEFGYHLHEAPRLTCAAGLQVVAPYIKNGTVLFPRSGCEQLLGQMFNLGVESHDDLVDAFVWLIQGLVSQGLELPKIHWIET
jgi:hypothetical protein